MAPQLSKRDPQLIADPGLHPAAALAFADPIEHAPVNWSPTRRLFPLGKLFIEVNHSEPIRFGIQFEAPVLQRLGSVEPVLMSCHMFLGSLIALTERWILSLRDSVNMQKGIILTFSDCGGAVGLYNPRRLGILFALSVTVMSTNTEQHGRQYEAMGRRLALIRSLNRLTQKEIAADLGIGVGHYWKCEAGEKQLGGSARKILFSIYEVSQAWFETGIGDAPCQVKNAGHAIPDGYGSAVVHEKEITMVDVIKKLAREFGYSEDETRERVMKSMGKGDYK